MQQAGDSEVRKGANFKAVSKRQFSAPYITAKGNCRVNVSLLVLFTVVSLFLLLSCFHSILIHFLLIHPVSHVYLVAL